MNARCIALNLVLNGVLLAGCGGGSTSTGAGTSDVRPPTATLIAPAALASGLTGTLNLTATASGNNGVAGVEFQIDGEIIGAEVVTAPYQISLDSSPYSAGQHVLRARARDAAGNLSAWSSATVQFGGTRDLPAGFTKEEAWVSLLSSATAFAQAPDGRLFICEQGGNVRVVKDGNLLSTPFVQLDVDSTEERGLLGVALHPDFANNGWVYLYHTTMENGAHNRIRRFTAAGDLASQGSETIIVDLPPLSSATNHNGGAIHFGVDGKLYAGVGDNADGAKSQNLADPFGKLLRFNDDGTIPTDNPFHATQTGIARAVWA